jgi:hypothetical protein
MSAMSSPSLDAPGLRAAMAAYLEVASRLDEAASTGAEARDLLELAESKAIASMVLRRRLAEAGFDEPADQRVTQ